MYSSDELSELFNGDNYSKIVSLHRYSRIGCTEYTNIMQMADQTKQIRVKTSETDTQEIQNNFYNVIDCSEIAVDDDDANAIFSGVISLVKSGNHFVPLIEIARECSNLVFVIQTNIPYVNSNYKFSDESGLCEFMRSLCKKVYKKMSVKTPMMVCMYIRCYKKQVYLKLHFVDYVMDMSNRVALMRIVHKKLSEDSTFVNAYPILYNEFYETSVLPLLQSSKEHYYWQLFRVFECRKSYGTSVGNIDKSEFIEKYINNEAISQSILSINNYTDKELYHRDVPIFTFENKLIKEEALLMREINYNTRIAYFDLVLRYLPIEYKQGEHINNIISSLKILDRKCLLLAKYHYMKANSDATEEDFYRIWNRINKVSMMGYYANIVRESDDYMLALKAFVISEIEKSCYSSFGNINDVLIIKLINCYFYGRYYSFEVIQKTNSNRICTYEYTDEYSDSGEEFLYKWRDIGNSKTIYRFMTEEMCLMFDAVFEKISTKGKANSYSKDPKEKALGKMVTAFNRSKSKLNNGNGINSLYKLFREQEISCGLFANRINVDKSVIGFYNGILDLDLDSSDPKPKLYTGYSPFIVTKSINAKYIPYDKNNQGIYLTKFKQIVRDIIPEKDARKKILFIFSTALDEKSTKMFVLMLLGWGCNGKSLLCDLFLYIFFMYGVKLSSKLITADRVGGAADPEFMKIKGHRYGLISETNKNDKLVSTRLKSVTEKIKEGRGLFQDSENFNTAITLIINTNYELKLDDTDYGTTRRIMIYYTMIRFVANPDPNDPHEKKVNPNLLDELLCEQSSSEIASYLVHLRCKLHRLYKSDIFKVESETIDKYTNEYKCDQDNITKFIHQRLVIMNGFKIDGKIRNEETLESIARFYDEKNIQLVEKLKMESVIREYVEWMKVLNGVVITEGYNSLLNSFKNSCIGKRIINDGELAHLSGIRVIERGQPKFDGELHLN